MMSTRVVRPSGCLHLRGHCCEQAHSAGRENQASACSSYESDRQRREKYLRVIEHAKGRKQLANASHLKVDVINHDDKDGLEVKFMRPGQAVPAHNNLGDEFPPQLVKALPIRHLFLAIKYLFDESSILWNGCPPHGRHSKQ